MTHFLHTQSDLEAGLVELIKLDPRLAATAETAGSFDLRRREGGYAGLCAIICGQQVSVASAAAMRDRLFAAFVPFGHEPVIAARTDKLKRLGLSNNKIKSMKEIGKAVSTGAVDLTAVGEMDADAAHALLTALHGVGPWTADIYLLFCLGHADAFPAGDLAVQEAARIALNLRTRPDAKALTKIAEAWRPWRGVAAHLMWGYYHVIKKREGIDVEAKPKVNAKIDAKKHWPQIKKTKTVKKTAKKTARKKPAKKTAAKSAKRKSANGSNRQSRT